MACHCEVVLARPLHKRKQSQRARSAINEIEYYYGACATREYVKYWLAGAGPQRSLAS